MKLLHCADLHLRTDIPICRKDEDWINTQLIDLEFIERTAWQNNCEGIVITGDIFNKPNVSDILKVIFLETFKYHQVYILPGQHDLPEHSWKKVDHSSFGVLWNLAKTNKSNIKTLNTIGRWAPFGQEFLGEETGLYFCHDLVFENKNDLPPNDRAKTAAQLLRELPEAKWVFCGDQHHGFHYQNKNKHVIMAGCINIQSADMIDYKPCVWVVDTEKETVQQVFIPQNENFVSNDHITRSKERDERISAFVTMLADKKGDVNFDYLDRVEERVLNDKNIDKDTEKAIRDIISEVTTE